MYLKQLWPKIRARLPDAELHIYGSYPAKKATQLHKPEDGFLVKGWASDALEVIRNARVCLSPLRFGAGIKGKLLDAMRVNTPSVTTSIGAEGMHGDLLWPGIVADDLEDIVNAAVKLYQDEELWQQKVSHIPNLLAAKYDGETNGQKLISKIQQIELNLQTHRENNFIGAMLNHHSLKSTMYMSKWIEEKTKNKPPQANN